MTRNFFLKSITVLLGVAVTAPLKLLKGKEVDDVVRVTGDIVVHNPFLKTFPKGEANQIMVSDGYGNIEWKYSDDDHSMFATMNKIFDESGVIKRRKELRKIKEQILLCSNKI